MSFVGMCERHHSCKTDVLEKYPNGLHVDKLARVVRLLATEGCFTEGQEFFFPPSAFMPRMSRFMISDRISAKYLCHQPFHLLPSGARILVSTFIQLRNVIHDWLDAEAAVIVMNVRPRALIVGC